MEFNWANLCNVFEACRKEDKFDSPYVDPGETSMTIDGAITREFVEKFIKEKWNQ